MVMMPDNTQAKRGSACRKVALQNILMASTARKVVLTNPFVLHVAMADDSRIDTLRICKQSFHDGIPRLVSVYGCRPLSSHSGNRCIETHLLPIPWGRWRRMALNWRAGMAMMRPMQMPYRIPSTMLTSTLYSGSAR